MAAQAELGGYTSPGAAEALLGVIYIPKIICLLVKRNLQEINMAESLLMNFPQNYN